MFFHGLGAAATGDAASARAARIGIADRVSFSVSRLWTLDFDSEVCPISKNTSSFLSNIIQPLLLYVFLNNLGCVWLCCGF